MNHRNNRQRSRIENRLPRRSVGAVLSRRASGPTVCSCAWLAATGGHPGIRMPTPARVVPDAGRSWISRSRGRPRSDREGRDDGRNDVNDVNDVNDGPIDLGDSEVLASTVDVKLQKASSRNRARATSRVGRTKRGSAVPVPVRSGPLTC